jgi:hypothetical protein
MLTKEQRLDLLDAQEKTVRLTLIAAQAIQARDEAQLKLTCLVNQFTEQK